MGRKQSESVFSGCIFLSSVPLPAGVPAQETAPAKLMVYLQRFRPLDYQRLLQANSCNEAAGDSTS